mgnify:CR=1 FL=1
MSSMDALTERQRQVYKFIRDKIRKRGYGPTVREIGEQFGIASPARLQRKVKSFVCSTLGSVVEQMGCIE